MFLPVISQIMGWVIVDDKKIPYSVYQKTEPLVRDLKKWQSVIEILDHEDPLSIPKALISVSGNLIEAPPIKKDPFYSYLKSRGSTFECPSCLEWMGEFLLHEHEAKEVCRVGEVQIAELKLNERLSIFFKIDTENKEEAFSEMYIASDATVRDEIYRYMSTEFWRNHETITMDKDRDEFLIAEYQQKGEDRVYKGEMNDFVDSLVKFKEKGIRRVVVFQGIPGTGKSTLCLNAAERLSKKTIIISNRFIQNVSKEEWDVVVNILLPEMVIIDDIDRVPQRSLETALHLFEDNTYHVPITLLTTNDYGKLPDAFLRPGRIDHIMTMPRPEPHIKEEMLDEFLRNLGIEDGYLTEENRKVLMKMMDNERISGAYIKEIVKRYWVYGNDYQIPENDEQFTKIMEKVKNDSPSHALEL